MSIEQMKRKNRIRKKTAPVFSLKIWSTDIKEMDKEFRKEFSLVL